MIVALAAVVVAVVGAAAGPGTAREFRVADTQVEDYPTVQAVLHMGRLIEEQTGGRHRLRVFHSRQLGEEQDTIEQTRVGAIDLNRTNVAPIGAIVPAANVLALPFLFRSTAHLHNVLDGPIGDEILASFEPYGFVGLTFYDSGARSIYTRNREVRSLADLKGLRIRVQQSDLMVAMIRALGATPVQLPYGQVDTGLATGLIDGAENNWPSYDNFHHYEVAKNYSLSEHSMAPEVLLISKRVYDSFTPEEQAQVRKAAKNSVPYMRELWDALEVTSRQKVEKAGVEVITIDKAPFQAAVAPLYDQFVTDPKLKDMIARIKAVQ